MPIGPSYRQGPSPIPVSLPDDWPRNEMGYYEPWNNSRMDELQKQLNDPWEQPSREEQWARMNRTPRSWEMILNDKVSPSMQAAFDRAEILASEREKRQGRPNVESFLEHREPRYYDVDRGMPWYADMPDSWFDKNTPGLPLTERTWERNPPAQLPPETGVDGYLEDPSTFQGPRTWKGPREELFFQYEWRRDFFFGFLFGKQKYIAARDEQAEQDAEFRERYQAYF